MLPPLAVLIPRIIRLLELLVELYGIFAPCVACALRGCFGCGRKKKKPEGDGGCDCPCPCPPPEEEKKKGSLLCGLRGKKVGKEKAHRDDCALKSQEEQTGKRRWWQCETSKGKKLHKTPPSSASRGLGFAEGEGEGDEEELRVLQRQYSSLPPPPPPPVAVVV